MHPVPPGDVPAGAVRDVREGAHRRHVIQVPLHQLLHPGVRPELFLALAQLNPRQQVAEPQRGVVVGAFVNVAELPPVVPDGIGVSPEFRRVLHVRIQRQQRLSAHRQMKGAVKGAVFLAPLREGGQRVLGELAHQCRGLRGIGGMAFQVLLDAPEIHRLFPGQTQVSAVRRRIGQQLL
ncbi:MAG: hypothetical protein BWY76_02986 [bacterium ADurb.Bin429]|nr:MAG: hypothetical protein BWY76_02986 [bacterium ADurb.Bin429]